jgi:hypothetical protein
MTCLIAGPITERSNAFLIFRSTASKRFAAALFAVVLLFGLLAGGCSLNPNILPAYEIPLPPGLESAILPGLFFDERLNRLIIPGGRAGVLFLMDPGTQKLDTLPIFDPESNDQSSTGAGVVSAARGAGISRDLLFVIDQNGPFLHAVDPGAGKIVDTEATEGLPELVRYIPTQRGMGELNLISSRSKYSSYRWGSPSLNYQALSQSQTARDWSSM